MPLLHKVATEDYEALRVTVVMNGGVSLAVWIGGVAQEIHRLQKGAGVYAQLVDFTATRARVDVISGTSAGGINGAFLAVARVFGTDLTPLRDVWLQSGSLDELLRNPREKDPPSLLRGTYFSDELLKAFKRLMRPTPSSVEDASIDLTLTTTLLHGRPNPLADDFDAPINDPDHRGTFHFQRGLELCVDDFVDAHLAEQLALAARATASFPLAFEPVFCPPVPAAPENAPHMGAVRSFPTGRYLLDGGILDNKPIDQALNALASLGSKGEGRRVICYVVPSSGENASDQLDNPDKPPTIAEVAIASTSTLPMIQSISAQTNQIKDHNRDVRELRQTRSALASLNWEAVRSSAVSLFQAYRSRRADSAAVFVTGKIVQNIVLSDSSKRIGRRSCDLIASLFMKIFHDHGLPWVPDLLPPENTKRSDLHLESWKWGLFTVENIARTILDVLRRGIHLTTFNALDEKSAQQGVGIELKKSRERADKLLLEVYYARDSGGAFWKKRAADLPWPLGDHDAADRWANETATADEHSAKYGESAIAFAGLLAEAAPYLREVASSALRRKGWDAEKAGATELQHIIELLAPEGAAPEQVLVRLLHLEVVQFALGFSGRARDVADQVLELVEICPDNSSFLGLKALRERKPAGAALANFGGFYKKSWRANDWLLGRLHGAERLVRLLLDPERIRQLYFDQDPAIVCQQLESIAIPPHSDPDEECCRKWWNDRSHQVAEELAFLKDPAQLLPVKLVHTVDAVLYRLQVAILREELPLLALAIEDDIQNHHGPGKGGEFLSRLRGITANQGYSALRAVGSDVIEELYDSCRVDQETISEQSTSDHFTATITRAFAVGVSILAGKNVGIPRVGGMARALRFPALLTDAISQSLLRDNKVGVFAYAAVIGACAAILLLALSPTAHIPWLYFAAAAVVLVLSVGLFAGHGKHRLKLLVLLLLICIFLSSPEIRHVVWKTLTWVKAQVP